jgi:alkanesulfonate monooxygenase SsuD/methylene tetrahydromethanopterin reductase-like flavin-dependent oxidoreductase (luciferase family)
VIVDRSTGRYVDRAKVHDFDFEGKYFKGKGPLNVARSPQGRPVICQAGGSPTGREFSAKHADTVLLSSDGANSVQVLKDFRDDLRARAAANGRNPDDIKVLYMVTPVVADTDEQAEAIVTKRFTLTEAKVQSFVKGIGSYFSIDFTKYDLDKPLPIEEMRTEGHQTTLENFLRHADGGRRTFREMIARFRPTSLDLVGSLETVADKMEAAMAEIGGDGFLIQSRPLTRRYITEITEGLVPVLQRRGLTRSSYKHNYLREHLLEF